MTERILVVDNSWTLGEQYGCVHGAYVWWFDPCLGGRGTDIRPSYKDKLHNACLVPLLPAWLPGVWDILRLVCSREVPMPSMQGSYKVHLVEKWWQVFFVRQMSIIPPSWPCIQIRHQELYKRCQNHRPCTTDDDWCYGSCLDRGSLGQWTRRWFSRIWWATYVDS
jgi:hypothetical protein